MFLSTINTQLKEEVKRPVSQGTRKVCVWGGALGGCVCVWGGYLITKRNNTRNVVKATL